MHLVKRGVDPIMMLSIICLVNIWENNYFCIIIIIIGFKVHCFIYQQDVNVMTLNSLYYLLQVCVIIV